MGVTCWSEAEGSQSVGRADDLLLLASILFFGRAPRSTHSFFST
jgi:hypothetical protein